MNEGLDRRAFLRKSAEKIFAAGALGILGAESAAAAIPRTVESSEKPVDGDSRLKRKSDAINKKIIELGEAREKGDKDDMQRILRELKSLLENANELLKE